MYSFAQRTDTTVVDEPFYAYYLRNHRVEHPGRESILESLPNTVDQVMAMLKTIEDRAHLFIKGMAHHVHELPIHHFQDMANIIFIRDPKQLIASYAQVMPQPTMNDVGISHQVDLFRALKQHGIPALILDSGLLLNDPQAILTELCLQLGISWDNKMLSWDAGARPEDGVWAKYWYHNVHLTTGFAKQESSSRSLPQNCQELYARSLPLYKALRSQAIGS